MTQKTKNQYKIVIFIPKWGYGQTIIWYDENGEILARIWRHGIANNQSGNSGLTADEFDVLRKKYEEIEVPFYTQAKLIENTHGREYVHTGTLTKGDAYIVKIFARHSKGWAETVQW